MRPSRHLQTEISCGARRAEVDVGIAPLVLALWGLGIGTVGSCEEFRPGTARIWFETEQGRALLEQHICGHYGHPSGDWFVIDFPSEEITRLTQAIRP